MTAIIERIDVHTPETAQALQALVENFQYGQIQDLLREVV
jgi:hypothetical protein